MVIYYIRNVYLRPYVYSFGQIFQALRLFPALRLFRRGYQFSKTQIWCQKILDQINKQKKKSGVREGKRPVSWQSGFWKFAGLPDRTWCLVEPYFVGKGSAKFQFFKNSDHKSSWLCPMLKYLRLNLIIKSLLSQFEITKYTRAKSFLKF